VRCSHFHVCGGCSLPDTPYADQLGRKRARLAELLQLDVPPLIPSPDEAGFRSKVTFVFGTDRASGALIMGHFARGSTRIVAVAECPVHAGRGNRIAFALRDQLARAGIRAADTRGGLLRHLLVRTSEDESEAVAMLVVSRNDKSLRTPIRALLASSDRPDGFLVNINDKPGPYMVGPDTINIGGRSHIRETGVMRDTGLTPLTFLVSPTAFFQTNVGAARELLQVVTRGVGSASRVLDLYCGSGLFTLPLAASGAAVTAVEENRQAIADLKANLKLNRIPERLVRPICGRVEDVLDRIARERHDVVILDPPRDGCAPGVLASVFDQIAPSRVVYVSCNPQALAAELPVIRKSAYDVDGVQAVDMFPHTDHIEAIVTLRRRTADAARATAIALRARLARGPGEEFSELSDQNLPRRLVLEHEMIAAGQRDEPCAGDLGSQRPPFAERNRGVTF
jgi:23S rRNA (uracil1939-C5)-methyltransferase